MSSQSRFRVFLSAVLAATFVVATAGAANAYTLTGTKWSSSSVTITVNVSTTNGSYHTAAVNAVSNWSSSTDVNMTRTSSSLFKALIVADGENGLHGRAVWSSSGGRTTAATAYLNTTTTSRFKTNENRLRAIWSHEIGHGLGLGHVSSSSYIMYTCPSCVYTSYGYYTPRSDDRAGMNYLY